MGKVGNVGRRFYHVLIIVLLWMTPVFLMFYDLEVLANLIV